MIGTPFLLRPGAGSSSSIWVVLIFPVVLEPSWGASRIGDDTFGPQSSEMDPSSSIELDSSHSEPDSESSESNSDSDSDSLLNENEKGLVNAMRRRADAYGCFLPRLRWCICHGNSRRP